MNNLLIINLTVMKKYDTITIYENKPCNYIIIKKEWQV